jgi:magnesium chelatase family protein
VKFREMASAQQGEPSAVIRARVIAARDRQLVRFKDCAVSCNARMGSRELKKYCRLSEETLNFLRMAMDEYKLSARAFDRIQKVSRTIADLAASDAVTTDHVSEAIQLRALDKQLWG